jgi:uncharacterized membrane protein YfcA
VVQEYWLYPGLLQYGLAGFSALLVGLAKTGVPGVSLIFTAIMAMAVPGKEAIALVLLLLITGDVFAVRYYRKHTDWAVFKTLLPTVLIGLVLGTLILRAIPAEQIRPVLGYLILALLGIELSRRFGALDRLKKNPVFASFIGVSVGVCTVVGNAAGPVMGIFLLLRGMNKHAFMGTSAWFFFIINLLKVPLLLVIGLMSTKVFITALSLLPFVFVGAISGRGLLSILPEKLFASLVLATAAISALYFILLG